MFLYNKMHVNLGGGFKEKSSFPAGIFFPKSSMETQKQYVKPTQS